MDPAIISAGIGFLGNMFGGRPQVPKHVLEAARMQNGIFQRGLDLYDSTDLERVDKQSLDLYMKQAMQQAMQAATNYDAKMAGSGASILKGDTAKDRMRGQIFADAGNKVGGIAADLNSTRAARKAALLPQANANAQMQGAMFADQQNYTQGQAEQKGWADFVQLASGLVNTMNKSKGKATKTAGGTAASNDRNSLGSGSYMNYKPATQQSIIRRGNAG